MSNADLRPGQRQVGVFVVHGVGEADPGDCVDLLSLSLGKAHASHVSDATVRELPTPEARPGEKQTTTPIHTRQIDLLTGERLTLSELYWADLSRNNPGQLNAVLGLFRVLFEAHHLIGAMLPEKGNIFERMLRACLMCLSWLLRGPIAALTLWLSVVCGAFLFIPGSVSSYANNPLIEWVHLHRIGESYLAVSRDLLLLNVGMIVLSLPLQWYIATRTDAPWHETIRWIMRWALIILVVQLCLGVEDATSIFQELSNTSPIAQLDLVKRCELQASCPYSDVINSIYGLVKLQWIGWFAILMISLALLAVVAVQAPFVRRSRFRPAATALGIVILQFMLWSAVVVPSVFPILDKGQDEERFGKLRNELQPLAKEIRALSGKVSPAGKTAAQAEAEKPESLQLLERKEYIHLPWSNKFKETYGIVWLGLGLLMITVFLLVTIRNRLGTYFVDQRERAENLMPRLLFSPVIVAALVVFAVIELHFIVTGIHPVADRSIRNVLNLMTAAIALGSPMLVTGHFISGVHIARDLIDHQYQSVAPAKRLSLTALGFLKRRRQAAWLQLERRRRIQARLSGLLADVLARHQFDTIVFLAHSQGSVIVFDHLANQQDLGGLARRSKPALLTFGSPLGHIYQAYFHEYQDLQAQLARLRSSLAIWKNLYRVDDYVGQRIEGGANGLVENVPMARGGHTDYWSEPAVAQALIDIVHATARTAGPAAPVQPL